jgi:hypothetical protein
MAALSLSTGRGQCSEGVAYGLKPCIEYRQIKDHNMAFYTILGIVSTSTYI